METQVVKGGVGGGGLDSRGLVLLPQSVAGSRGGKSKMTKWVVWVLLALVPVNGVNFISSAVLPDGEHGVRMRFGDTLVKETSVIGDEDSRHRVGMMLRQVNSGPLVLQLIYEMRKKKGADSLRLSQCEILEDWPTANDFRTNFQKELTNAGLSLTVPTYKNADNATVNEFDEDPLDLEQAPDDFRNVTVRILSDDEVEGDLKKAFNVKMQKRRCLRLHRKLERIANETREVRVNSTKSKFRSCLKMTNSGAANFVGKLYFNIVQSKCFFLKPEKSCTKRTWWGKCLKYELKKQAYLKDPLPY